MEPKKSGVPGILWVSVVLLIVVLLGFFFLTNSTFLKSLGGVNSTIYTSQSNTGTLSITTEQSNSTTSGTISIAYPSDYSSLESYAISLINNDRQSANLSLANVSFVPSGQQHADSMLSNSYFSHWDTQGLKPYMRYTLLGGTGFVDENVAFEESTLPSFVSTSGVEQALNDLEYKMVHDDLSCCDNGHRDNILSPDHNLVSIGIAYDSTHVYFVEDFENYYTNLQIPIASGNGVVLKGNLSVPINPSNILIFYDRPPSGLNASTLNTAYGGPYTQGNFTGGIFPPCNGLFGCQSFQQQYCPNPCISDYASKWQVTKSSLDIEFTLSDFVKSYGNGVYTVYLEQGQGNTSEYFTSISVFVSQ